MKTEMQQIRKVIVVGNSKGITLPKAWLDFRRREDGRELKEVLMNIDDTLITISPVAPTGQERTNQ